MPHRPGPILFSIRNGNQAHRLDCLHLNYTGIRRSHFDLLRKRTQNDNQRLPSEILPVSEGLYRTKVPLGPYRGASMLLEDAVRRAARRLTGAYAISVISADAPDTIVTARNGPPAVIGVGEGESFVASDVPGILHHTRMMYFLADGDVAILTPQAVVYQSRLSVERKVEKILWDPIQAGKGGYKHFMLKEIWEQPRAVRYMTQGESARNR